jgi:hypothetical protein
MLKCAWCKGVIEYGLVRKNKLPYHKECAAEIKRRAQLDKVVGKKIVPKKGAATFFPSGK